MAEIAIIEAAVACASTVTWRRRKGRWAISARCAVAWASFCLVVLVDPCIGAADTNLFTGSGSVFIPFTSPVGTEVNGKEGVPQVLATFGSSTVSRAFTLDTGSTGIVVSPDVFNPVGLSSKGTGTISYSSSGITQSGSYYDTKFNYLAADGTVLATADVPVLVVTSQSCMPNARACNANVTVPTNVSQMGVGFGQETAGQPTATPDHNPLLNIVSTMNGVLPSKGYIVGQTGVVLGLTAAQTQGFSLVKLSSFTQYATDRPEWLLAPADVSVNGTLGRGSVLTDTGVTGMYLTAPPAAGIATISNPQQDCHESCAAPGTTVQVYLPGQTTPIAAYGFTTGALGGKQAGIAVAPQFVAVDRPSDMTFVNTSANFLQGFDYLYDATDGFVGYRPTGAAAQYAAATIAMTLQGSVTLPAGFTSNLPTYLMDYAQVASTAPEATRGFLIQNGVPVALSASGTASFASPLAGPGSLELAAGTVALSARNTYTGTTAIDAHATLTLLGAGSIAASAGLSDNGVLDVSGTVGGSSLKLLSGAGRIQLGSQPLTLAFGGRFDGVIADGGLSGGSSGSVTVSAGTQVLTGASTYTGPTTIEAAGTLALAGTGSIAKSTVSLSGGTFDVSAATAAVSAGLAGSGTVRLGGQTLTLSNAAATFAGSITDGGIAGGNGGRLVVAGGTQVLTGASSYTGGTLVTNGATLAITGDAALGAPTAAVILDHGTLQAQGVVVSARPVSITAAGGTLDATNYRITLTGGLVVGGDLTTQGAVEIDGRGTVAGQVRLGGYTSLNGMLQAGYATVPAGATLRGVGLLATPLWVGGVIAPGNSPGTLTVAGPVVIASGATSEFDIDGAGSGTGAGNTSRLVVSPGSISLGGIVAPVLRGITGSATNDYVPPLGASYTIVTAAGGITGSYASLTQPAGLLAGTRFDTLYAPTTLLLVVTPAFYGHLGALGLPQSRNQQAVGAALDVARPAAGVAMTAAQAALYRPLYTLPGAGLPGLLDQLAPTIYGSNLLVQRDSIALIGDAVAQQMMARRGASLPAGGQSAPGPRGATVWAAGLGQFVTIDRGPGPGLAADVGGAAAGIDLDVPPWLTIGAFLGFTGPSVQEAGSGGSLDGRALHLGVYGTLRRGIAFLDLQGSGTFFETDIRRAASVFGAAALGHGNGAGGGGSLRGGLHVGAADWQFEPSLGLSGSALHQHSATETISAAASGVAAGGIDSLQTWVGAQTEQRFRLGVGNAAITALARLGWTHELADTSLTTNAVLQNVSYAVHSARIGRDAAVVGLGGRFDTGTPLRLFLDAAGAFSGRDNSQSLTGGLTASW